MATEMPASLLAMGGHGRATEEPAGAGRTRRRLGALGLVAAFGLAGLSTAQAWPRGAELQLDATTRFDYEEPNLMEEEGDLLGLAIAYTGQPGTPPGSWPLRFEGRLRTGEMDYDGSVRFPDGSTAPAVSDTEDIIADLRLLTGKGPGSTLFYGGLGLRLWDQDLKDAQLKADGRTVSGSGYDRGHRYGYLPLGVRLEPPVGRNWTVHLEAEYQAVFWGEAYADFSALDERTFDMDDGYGLALRTGARYAATSALALIGEVYLQYWDFDISDPDEGFLEPANETEEVGMRFGINW